MSDWELYEYCRDVIGFQNCVFDKNCYTPKPPDYYFSIPCGTCYHCLKNKRSYWVFRLLTELEQYKQNTFVTLTLTDENLLAFKGDYKRPLKLYLDRLRKALGFRPRYWFISELGDEVHYSGRLHYHGIIFDTDKDKLSYALQRSKWSYGFSYFGYVQYKTAYYLTKYLTKQQPKEDYKPFILCSNGIGASYITEDNFVKLLNNFEPRSFIEFHGKKFPLSPYYRYKFFDQDILLCNMLNRFNSVQKNQYRFRGIDYTNPKSYLLAVDRYYKQTISDGLSLPVKCRVKNYIFYKTENRFNPFDIEFKQQLTLFENG